MQKTQIDWADYSVNPVGGLCPVGCEYCYARALYQRYGWDVNIAFRSERLKDIARLQRPSRIFVGSTIELFGPWVKQAWMAQIRQVVLDNPRHTFIFLTKRPWEMSRWRPWPDNTWLGVTITKGSSAPPVRDLIETNGQVLFASVEPLLGPVDPQWLSFIDWVIVGGMTGPRAVVPKLEWVKDLETVREWGVALFYKDNLLRHFPELAPYREFPRGRTGQGVK